MARMRSLRPSLLTSIEALGSGYHFQKGAFNSKFGNDRIGSLAKLGNLALQSMLQ